MYWKTILSYISGSVDEDLLLRNEYLVAENRVFRNQFQGCLRLTDSERRSLAERGKRLGKQALDEIASTEPSRQGESAAVPSQMVLALFTVGDVYASLCKKGAYAPFSAQRRSRALF